MNIANLEIFMKAYKSLNYSKAAEDFFVTPQGVSKMIHRLEDELGCTLFERSKHGVLPTQEAHILAHYAETVLESTEQLKASLKNPFHMQKAVLKAVFATGLLSYLTPEFWNSFRDQHPDIELKLWEYPDTETDAIMRAEQAEIGFQSAPIDFTYYEAEPFTRHEIVAVMNVDHPLVRKGCVTYADFHDEILCILGPEYFSYNQNMNLLQNANAKPKEIYITKDVSNIESYAKNTSMIGICVDFVAARLKSYELTYVSFEPKNYWNTFIIKRKGRVLTSAAEAFICHAQNWVGEKAAEN